MSNPEELPNEYREMLVLPLTLLHRCGYLQPRRSYAVVLRFVCFVLFYIMMTSFVCSLRQRPRVSFNELSYVVTIFLINTQMFRSLAATGSWNYMLTPLLLNGIGLLSQQQWEFTFPFHCSFPFDPTRNWFTYVLAYVFEVYSMTWTIDEYIGIIILTITLCGLLSVELEHLQDDILNIINISKEEESTTDTAMMLRMFSKRHQILIMMPKELNNIFNKIIFVDIFFATLTICLFGFCATITIEIQAKITNFFAIMSLIVPIYIMCYYGEMLYNASLAISDSVYNTTWYNKDVNSQRTLLYILTRAQHPCTMNSMYTPVTLKLFATVLSTTWSYFSLINTIYEDSNQLN